MKRAIVMMLVIAAMMQTRASDCGQASSTNKQPELSTMRPSSPMGTSIGFTDNPTEEQKWRRMLNFYITTQTSFSAIGMHDIIERTKLDINAIDEKGLTPLQLAQQEGNGIAVKYLLSRKAIDTNPDRSRELLESIDRPIVCIEYKIIRSQPITQPIFIESNTTTVTAPPVPPQPIPAPATLSPEISGYTGSKRLKESPKDDDDDDDDN